MDYPTQKFGKIGRIEFLQLCRDTFDAEGSYGRINVPRHDVEESFPYIPYTDAEELFELFSRLSEKFGGRDKVQFLDVGCGTGRIVHLARAFGFQSAKGLEFHLPYIVKGNQLYNFPAETLIHGNALEMTKEFLRPFNVIYTYMPIAEHERMSELHISMYNKAGAQTILVEMLPMYYPMTYMIHNGVLDNSRLWGWGAVWKNYARTWGGQ